METFTCPRCKKIKPQYKKSGWCKDCKNEYSKLMYATNEKRREYIRNYVKKWFKKPNNKIMHMVKGMISRAKSAKKYPEKVKARNKFNHEIKMGRIIRPNRCPVCNSTKRLIEGHHMDYSKPLEVVWMCRLCHKKIERKYK